jgi:hypothetical protein
LGGKPGNNGAVHFEPIGWLSSGSIGRPASLQMIFFFKKKGEKCVDDLLKFYFNRKRDWSIVKTTHHPLAHV